MKKETTLIIACLASATAGVIFGMLLSDETRKNFQEAAKKFGGELMTKFSAETDSAADLKENHGG